MPDQSIEITEPMRPDESLVSDRPGPIRSGIFYCLVLMTFCLQQLVQWPIGWDFHQFVLYDSGSALKADAMVASGLKPGVDFAYSYGLLSIDAGRLWFSAFGRTPFGYTSLTLCCSLLLALGIMHAALAMRLKVPALILLLIALPYAIQPYYLNQTHAMEAAILIWAIGFQARGKLGTALALVTACLFIKPSMAYLYGFILTLWIILDIFRSPAKQRFRIFLRSFAPAVMVLIILGLYLSAKYGMPSLIATFFPTGARKSYQLAHFGFFTDVGKGFWAPDHPLYGILHYYTFTEAGFWLLGLGMTAMFLLIHPLQSLIKHQWPDNADRTLYTVILLHILFVLLLYAWTRSWIYYGYMLTLGVAGVADRLPDAINHPTPFKSFVRRWSFATALGIIAMLGMTSRWYEAAGAWGQKTPTLETQGLRAYDSEATEWGAIHELLRNSHGLFLGNGNATLMYGDVRTPKTWFMSPGLQTPAEIADIREQIKSSTIVVRYKELSDQGYDPWDFPDFQDLTPDFEDITNNFYSDKHNDHYDWAFTIMRRKTQKNP